jgi:hypothetical protein
VDDDTTWAERASLYGDLLAKPDSMLIFAEIDDGAVGCGLAHGMARATRQFRTEQLGPLSADARLAKPRRRRWRTCVSGGA